MTTEAPKASPTEAKAATAPDAAAHPAILEELQQAFSQARRFASIQVDLVRLRLARSAQRFVLLIAVGFVMAVVLAMSAVYLMRGVAGALEALTGGPAWLGFLLSGLLGLGGVASLAWLARWRTARAALQRSLNKYGRRGRQSGIRSDTTSRRPDFGARIPSAGGERSAVSRGAADAAGHPQHGPGA